MLYQALQKIARRYPEKVAVIGETRSLRFAALLREVREQAAMLQAQGLRPGQTVLVGIPPSPDFYVFFYAATALGLVVIPLLPSEKIPETAKVGEPVMAVGPAEFIQSALTNCPTVQQFLPWSREHGLERTNIGNAKSFRRKRLIADETILGLLTSGTTGEPTLHHTSAAALLRHGQLRAQVIGIRADDVLLSTRPFNNMSSMDAPLILPVITGCTVVVHENFQRYHAARAMSEHRVTVIYGVPIIFEMLASIPVNYDGDFSALRLGVSGGAPLPNYVYEKFRRRFGIGLRQRYGGTQFFPGFNFDTRGVPGAVGQIDGPFPMALIDKNKKPVPTGAIGEIVLDCGKLRDPFWRACFKSNPDRDGRYLHTGDLGRVDDNGTLFIVGRIAPFIKVGGNRVAPAEVESVMRSHPKVRDSIVFAYHPGQHDEAVQAIVVPSQGLKEAELLAFCAERLAPYKCPRRLEFRPSLPRNAQGKIVRHQFTRGKSLGSR